MGHYHKRPEKGACDAMSRTYGNTLEPCCHKARYVIGGKNLCRRHAFIIALDMAIDRKDAVEIPGSNRNLESYLLPIQKGMRDV